MKQFQFNNTIYIVPDTFDTTGMQDQRGQTCGLYALENVLHLFGIIDVFATEEHQNTGKVYDPLNVPSLRKIAKNQRVTQIGEIFDARAFLKIMPNIKTTTGKQAEAIIHDYNITTIADMQRTRASYFLVPFDVCQTSQSLNYGCPCTQNQGSNAHWCLIAGVSENQTKLLAVHWKELFEFNPQILMRSNAQLEHFPFSDFIKWKTNMLYNQNPRAFEFLKHYPQPWDKSLITSGQIGYRPISPENIDAIKAAAIQTNLNEADNELYTLAHIPDNSLLGLKNKMVEIKLK